MLMRGTYQEHVGDNLGNDRDSNDNTSLNTSEDHVMRLALEGAEAHGRVGDNIDDSLEYYADVVRRSILGSEVVCRQNIISSGLEGLYKLRTYGTR